MFMMIYRAGLNPVFTIKIVLKWPNNHFNFILLIWQCSICVEIHWKYFERHNLRIFYLTRDTCIWKGSEKNWSWKLLSLNVRNEIENFESKLEIPHSKLSNFDRNFPTKWSFQCKLSIFRLFNFELSNFSFFPTALFNYMYPNIL